MLSILIGHSYFLRFDRKQSQRAKPYPPLATLQAAALLRQAGHQVSLFDAMLAESTREFELKLQTVNPQVALFYEDNYNYLSKMCLGKMRRAACEMIASAHRSGVRVIAAGSDVSDAPEVYLQAGADVVLIGEGLSALLELLPRLDADPGVDNRPLIEGLSGTATLTDGKVEAVSGARILPTPQLNELPAWDLVDVGRYRAVWVKAHGYFSLNMAASRGCSFRCSWCAKPIWGSRYLQRSATAVATEMMHLQRTFDANHIWFADDIFGFRVDWVNDFAAALAAGGGGVPFTIQLRADLVKPRMATALREAGCREVWMGAESGSQGILDAMNKGTRVDDIQDARALLSAEGIRVGFFLMLGYVGEKLDDILATRDLVERARPDDIGVSVAYPLPGTRFYEVVRRQLGDKRNWQQSSDLEMMFWGTYRSEFYRLVRDLLHDQVAEGLSPVLQRRWDDLVRQEAQFRQQQEDLVLEAGLVVPAAP